MKKYHLWIKALVPEGVIFLGSLFLPILEKLKSNNVAISKEGTPIILVHGYMHRSFVWFYHAKKLNQNGFGPVFSIDLKKPFSSIKDHAYKLQKKIIEVNKLTNTSQVILIGHSMGGLVASYYALNLAKENSVKDVITIASPLQGTHLAIFGLGKCAKEMRRSSKFVEDLTGKILNEKNINFYHIATKTDQLVHPFTSSLVGDNFEKQYVLDGIGHASLLYSKKVSDKIINWIK